MTDNTVWLVNYRGSGVAPMKSITQLPYKEAAVIAAHIYNTSPCPAHRRFGPDFPSYYKFRLEIEKRLYDAFKSLGGNPEYEHPYYFTVGDCENLNRNFGNGAIIKLPLDIIDPQHISFTYGDSMRQEELNDTQPLFTKDTLMSLLKEHSGNAVDLINSIKERFICIEAQLWSDKYFSGHS